MRALLAALMLLLLCAFPATAQQPEELEGEFLTQGHHRIEGGHADIVLGFHQERGLTLMLRDHEEQPPVWRPMDHVVVALGDDASTDLPPFVPAPTAAVGRAWVVPGEPVGETSLGWALDGPGITGLDVPGAALRLKHVEGPGDFALVRGGHTGQLLWTTGREEPQDEIWLETNEHSHDSWVFYEPGTYRLHLEAQVGLYTSRSVLTVEIGTFGDQTYAAAKTGNWLVHGSVLAVIFLTGMGVWWLVRHRQA